jgi:hypothetical protein
MPLFELPPHQVVHHLPVVDLLLIVGGSSGGAAVSTPTTGTPRRNAGPSV